MKETDGKCVNAVGGIVLNLLVDSEASYNIIDELRGNSVSDETYIK